MKLKAAVFLLGVVLVAVAGGSASASVLGGVGLLLMGAAGFPVVVAPSPVQVRPVAPIAYQVGRRADSLTVYELEQGGGVVVFRFVDGRLTSRFFRAVG